MIGGSECCVYHPVCLACCICTQRYTPIGCMLPLHSIHFRLFIVARCMYHPVCFASCICSLDNSAYASIQAFPNVFLATIFSDTPQNVHSNTTMNSYVRLLSFSWLALGRLSRLSSFQSYQVSFGVNRSGQHFCTGSIFLFCSLCRGC